MMRLYTKIMNNSGWFKNMFSPLLILNIEKCANVIALKPVSGIKILFSQGK